MLDARDRGDCRLGELAWRSRGSDNGRGASMTSGASLFSSIDSGRARPGARPRRRPDTSSDLIMNVARILHYNVPSSMIVYIGVFPIRVYIYTLATQLAKHGCIEKGQRSHSQFYSCPAYKLFGHTETHLRTNNELKNTGELGRL